MATAGSQALADTLAPTATAPAAVSGVSVPTTGTVSFNVPNVGEFSYNMSTKVWTGPAGWAQLYAENNQPIPGTLALNANTATQQTIVFPTPPQHPTIVATGPGTTTSTALSPTFTNSVTSSSVLGAGATSNGSVAVTGPGSLPVASSVANLPYTYSNAANPGSNLAGTATAALIEPVVSTTVVPPNGSVVVTGAAPQLSTGNYTVQFNGTSTTGVVTGTSFSQTANNGLSFNGLTGTATIESNGVITSNVSVNPSQNTTIDSTGISTTGTLSVGGATTTNGITNTGNITNSGNISTATLNTSGQASLNSVVVTNNASVGGNLAVTGTTSTNGITNNGNIATTTLSTTGNATVGGTLNAPTVVSSSVTNGAGNGVTMSAASTTTTGGSTSLRLENGGASFSGAAGAPVRVSGIANGVNQFDAINLGQLQVVQKEMQRGVAAASALAALPQVEPGKTFQLGVALGNYASQTAFAIGGSYRINENSLVKFAVGTAGGGKVATSAGYGMSW